MNPNNEEIEFDLEEFDPSIVDSPSVSSVHLTDQDIKRLAELLLDTSNPELLTGPYDAEEEGNSENYQELDITRVIEKEIAGAIELPDMPISGEKRENRTCSFSEDCMNLDIAAIESDLELDSITHELEDISNALYKDKTSAQSLDMCECWGGTAGYPSVRTQRQSSRPSNQVGMLLPMTHTITPQSEQYYSSSERVQRLLSGLPVPALYDFDEHIKNKSFQEVDNPTPKTTTSVQHMSLPRINSTRESGSNPVMGTTEDETMSQIDLIRHQSGNSDFSNHTIFSPTTPNVLGQPPGSQPKLRYSEGASASHYCHICGRASNTAQLAACANVKLGLCRKTLCEKCLLLHQRNLFSWAKARNSTWTCTHCRGVCPKRARCHQYQRNNMRRRLQNSRRINTQDADGKQLIEASGVRKRRILDGNNISKERTSKKKVVSANGVGSKRRKKGHTLVGRLSKAKHQQPNSTGSRPNYALPSWHSETTTPKSIPCVETVKDSIGELSNASVPTSEKKDLRGACGEWLNLSQEFDHEKELRIGGNVDCEALDELIEKSISQY